MKKYIVYKKNTGKILRTGVCQNNSFDLQAQEGEAVMEGIANDVIQKVVFNGFDEKDQPINPHIVDKSPEEIEAAKPSISPDIPEEQKPANITKGQLQAILNRIEDLEGKINGKSS